MEPIIGDFGLSRFENTILSCYPGTPGYIAPEIINNDPYSFPADIYSFGCTLFYLLFNQRPYHFEKSENRTNRLSKNINIIKYYREENINKKINLKIDEIESSNNYYYQLMKKCIEIDPFKRPTINEIYEELYLFGKKQFSNEVMNNLFDEIESPNSFKERDENGSLDQIKKTNSYFTLLCNCLYSFEILKNNENGINYLKQFLEFKTTFSKNLLDYCKNKNFIPKDFIIFNNNNNSI